MDYKNLKALFMVSAFNGLSQKIWCELHSHFKASDLLIGVNSEVVHAYNPDIVICPFMKDYIPERIWSHYPCFIVHPGPANDGGPSSLNRAVLEKKKTWGVTILKADEGWDEGDIWAVGEFEMPQYSVASIYRNEVADMALQLLPRALDNFFSNQPAMEKPKLVYKPAIRQQDLAFTWDESTVDIVSKINAGDSSPGTECIIKGRLFKLFGAFPGTLNGKPGEILEVTTNQMTIATGDGSVSLTRLAGEDGIKLRPDQFGL